jgi:hypothetical protein
VSTSTTACTSAFGGTGFRTCSPSASAFDVVIAALDHERNVPLVGPLADLGRVAIIEPVIEDGGRQTRTRKLHRNSSFSRVDRGHALGSEKSLGFDQD